MALHILNNITHSIFDYNQHAPSWGIYKESVKMTFVYLPEGCGKTRLEINDTIPHTRIDMGYQGTEHALPQLSIRK